MAMHGIERLKYKLLGELDELGSAEGELSPNKIDYVDKLAHAAKCLCKILDGEEQKESYRGSYAGGMDDGFSRRSYAMEDPMDRSDAAYRRRDSMGRFSRAGGNEEMMHKLRTVVRETKDEKTRQMVQRLLDDMDQ